jgi:hypothetical protein
MSNPTSVQIQHFNRVLDSWKRAIVSVNLSFASILVDDSWTLLSARVEMGPFECTATKKDIFTTSQLKVGNIFSALSVDELAQFIEKMRLGEIEFMGLALKLPDDQGISLYTPILLGDPDYFTPQLEIRGKSQFLLTHQFDYEKTNAELRCGEVPFDGIADLLSFFNLGNSGHLPQEPKISLKIYPPADLVIDRCSLTQNCLKLRIFRQASFSPAQVSIGLRQFPNPTIARRKQIGAHVNWSSGDNGFDSGDLEMDLEDCATAELMVSVDGFTARRWFLFDPHKSLNPRLTDYRYLDPNLTQIKKYLTSPKDARQLEVGTAALLHLLGANSLNPPGSDSPDVIVETANKRLALVECTTRVENVREKTAKLVGRRDGLIATENKYGIIREVMAILLVNQPLTSLVNEQAFLTEHRVNLMTLEDINSALANLEIPPDLDKLYVEKMEAMRSTQLSLFSDLNK